MSLSEEPLAGDPLAPRAPGTAVASERAAGWVIASASILSLAAMAHHPPGAGGAMGERLAEMQRTAHLSGLVHGFMVLLLGFLLLGFTGLCRVLGWQRLGVRAGAVAYGLGVVFFSSAALVSGFLVPALAARYAGLANDELESLRPVFGLAYESNQTLAESGTIAFSVALAAWSLVLLGRTGAARTLGCAGLFVAVAPAAMLFIGYLSLDLHGMGVVVLAQSLWSLAVAVWMIRGRASAGASAAVRQASGRS